MSMASKVLKSKRILFVLLEIGGQMQLMVEELRRRGYFATVACDHQEFRGYVKDIQLNARSKDVRLRRHGSGLLSATWVASPPEWLGLFFPRPLRTGRAGRVARSTPCMDLPQKKWKKCSDIYFDVCGVAPGSGR